MNTWASWYLSFLVSLSSFRVLPICTWTPGRLPWNVIPIHIHFLNVRFRFYPISGISRADTFFNDSESRASSFIQHRPYLGQHILWEWDKSLVHINRQRWQCWRLFYKLFHSSRGKVCGRTSHQFQTMWENTSTRNWLDLEDLPIVGGSGLRETG